VALDVGLATLSRGGIFVLSIDGRHPPKRLRLKSDGGLAIVAGTKAYRTGSRLSAGQTCTSEKSRISGLPLVRLRCEFQKPAFKRLRRPLATEGLPELRFF
jgi:hypothetical protein